MMISRQSNSCCAVDTIPFMAPIEQGDLACDQAKNQIMKDADRDRERGVRLLPLTV